MLQALRGNQRRNRVATGASVPAPVGGWDAISPLASMKPDRAIVLDNWFPRPGYVEVRRGHRLYARGMGTTPVETIMKYDGLTTASGKMFAICDGTIFDVTSFGRANATTVTGLSNNRFQYVNYTTSAGTQRLWACSGADTPKMFDGSSWATPSITGVSSSDIVNVNVFKNRLWFVMNNSMNAAYLNTDSIQGTATPFNLGSVMGRGGFLMAMGTWTHDAGSGPDDYAVFVSNRGQAAVYQGIDPSDASTFGLVGVYDFAPPIGRRCCTKVAGDLALVTLDGVMPFSIARSVDRGADAAVALTANINTAMNIAARSYKDNFGWELTAYSKGMMAILNVPVEESTIQHQYVMNTLTGAWCRFTNMNSNCWIDYHDQLFFGGNAGVVYQADYGSQDIDNPIDAQGQGAYQYFRSRGRLKQFNMLQPLITADSDARPSLGISTDFKDNATLGTPSSALTAGALYDIAIWDSATYPTEARNVSDWTSINGVGQCASIHFKARVGAEIGINSEPHWATAIWGTDVWSGIASSDDIVMQLNGFNLVYEVGEFL